jgi:hypothetical protein
MLLVAGLEKDISMSIERYDDLTKRLEKAYGAIDYNAAKDLIDFMNPNRDKFRDDDDSLKGYYKVNGEIKGHHDIFDNGELIMESLYGFYKPGEPWARVDLKPFLQ